MTSVKIPYSPQMVLYKILDTSTSRLLFLRSLNVTQVYRKLGLKKKSNWNK